MLHTALGNRPMKLIKYVALCLVTMLVFADGVNAGPWRNVRENRTARGVNVLPPVVRSAPCTNSQPIVSNNYGCTNGSGTIVNTPGNCANGQCPTPAAKK